MDEVTPGSRTDAAATLKAITPEEARGLYLQSREEELADRTLTLHKRRTDEFVKWCQDEDIDNLNDLTARTVHQFRLHIQGGVATSTLAVRLNTIRIFVEFCESIDAVAPGVSERVVLPERDDGARTEMLDSDDAGGILTHYRKFRYATIRHAVVELMWHTGLRTGSMRALDVEDFQEEQERLRIRHRPETDTPLKNGESAERFVALSEEVSILLRDYIAEARHDVQDEFGREPLFTTKQGRPCRQTFTRYIYDATQPCSRGEECPIGRDPDDCKAATNSRHASKCPESVSGHPVRRGSITHYLGHDVPEKVVSDRMDVSPDIIDRHYDRRTEHEKAEQRRDYLDGV